MRLSKIFERLSVQDLELVWPGADAEVTSLTEDSRKVQPGALFAALPGERTDGHAFVEAAVAAGASAILGGRPGINRLAGLPYLSVARPRAAAGIAAHFLAGDPSRKMCVMGVTGTNGKSSTVCLIQSIFRAEEKKCANFGTLGYDVVDRVIAAPHTTPFCEDLAAIFSAARDAGCTHAAMEVSSHALDQERVAGVEFNAAAFTNLTQDHLDYHGDMERYLDAKLKLFERIPSTNGITVVNAADPHADVFATASPVPCIRYGDEWDVRAVNVEMCGAKVSWRLETPWGAAPVEMRLLGKHNLENALCAAAVCGALGVSPETIAMGLGAIAAVPGRFEAIDAGQSFQVIVDYAHTEDGLRNVLRAAREICSGRLITVFGCGGDRDRGKRPKMGAAAAELADFAVLTSDNPRTEDPHQILVDVEAGMSGVGRIEGKHYVTIESREEAINHALSLAKAGDLVLIAGKGHEDYQIIGTERIHFDDREVVRNILGART